MKCKGGKTVWKPLQGSLTFWQENIGVLLEWPYLIYMHIIAGQTWFSCKKQIS